MTNLIAAGEVVERPSSVVKELIENAIDAQARFIRVDLSESGTKEIIVTDDGIGMDEDDALMAVERHATSKIRTQDDLYRIGTLGFRGEALPSIAAVSKMTISTSANGRFGLKLFYSGGILQSKETVAMMRGTVVSVLNLFFNTPARFKHIQSMPAELSHSIDIVTKYAFAHPEIAFSLSNNGKVILKTSGSGNLHEVLHDIYGHFTAIHMIPFHGKESWYEISGFASDLSVTRSSRQSIHVLTNQRAIKNTSLVYAILDGYKEKMVSSRYPVVVLHITTDPSLIDVNIHPSKFEIKFTEENRLKSRITKSIQEALDKVDLIPDALPENTIEQEESILPFNPHQKPSTVFESFSSGWAIEPMEMVDPPIVVLAEPTETFETYFQPSLDSMLDVSNHPSIPSLEYIGQFHGTYLLAQNEQHLFLIDQHAAMERVMYERISDSFAAMKADTVDLLIPFQLDFPPTEIPLVETVLNSLASFGVYAELFGQNTLLVRRIPTWFVRGAEEEFVRDMIEHLIKDRGQIRTKLLDQLAKSLSCKNSIKANMGVSSTEVRALLDVWIQTRQPNTCPHGRPTIVKLSIGDIEKMFKRVV